MNLLFLFLVLRNQVKIFVCDFTGQAERLLLQLFHGFDSHRGQANCGHTQSKITNIIYSCYRISDMHERRLSFRLVPDYI